MRESPVYKIIRKSKQVLINNAIRILGLFIKKDYSLWLFSMDGGTRFSGNVLYFYEYIKKNHSHIKTICFANTSSLQQRIKKNGGDVCSVNSFKSFISVLKAGVCVFSHEMAHDLVNFSRKNTYKINLWHGGGIKKIQYGSKKIRKYLENKPLKMRLQDKLIGYIRHEEYDFIAYKAEVFAGIMAEAFNNKNIYLTGNPRDDIFFRKINRNDILKKYQLEEAINKTIITYLPTFRDVRRNDETYLIFGNNPSVLGKINNNGLLVLQKNHQSKLKERINKGNVYNLTDDIEPQELLYITDILITDYSGCYFDFLHTLRPIIFYPYDFKEYITKDRELYFDYSDEVVTPGIKAYTEEELFIAIDKYVKNPQLDKGKREKSLRYFQKYSDGKASERVYEVIMNIINSNGVNYEKRNCSTGTG